MKVDKPPNQAELRIKVGSSVVELSINDSTGAEIRAPTTMPVWGRIQMLRDAIRIMTLAVDGIEQVEQKRTPRR